MLSIRQKRFRFPMAVAVVFLSIWTLLLFTFSASGPHDADLAFEERFKKDYRIYSIPMPENVSFCGNTVPLFDTDVRERLDRELLVNTYWQSNTLLLHKRAHRWFPIIEPILKANGIPDDFKYLAVIESGLTQAVSPSKAVGFWQLLEATGKQYGLEVNDEVDERYHIEKSTEAACKYLTEAYNKLGSWEMAAGGYNMGMGGINKQMGRQGTDNYYDLILNQETNRYLFRIIAAKVILENPTRYGFHFREKDLYQPEETYEVAITGPVEDFSKFATEHSTSYKVLKIFNPWLRENYLTNKSGKTYTVRLPKKGYFNLSSADRELLMDTALWSPPTPDGTPSEE